MSDFSSPGQPSVGRSRRSSSAVKSLLGHAGQALGVLGAPSIGTGPGTSTRTSEGGHPLSPTNARTGRLGHPSHQPHPAQAPYIVDPPPAQLHQYLTSPATSPSTATFPRLPTPVSVTGTGSGSGSGFGFGFQQQQRQHRAVSAVVPSRQPHFQSHSRYDKYQAGSTPSNSPTRNATAAPRHSSTSTSASSRSFSLAGSHHSPTRALPHPSDHRDLPSANAIIPHLILPTHSSSSAATKPGPVPTLGSRPMFDLPSIPTSNDDFAAIPYLNSASSSTTTSTSSATTPQSTMSQPPQQPPQYGAAQRRTTGYGDEQQQQHHLQGSTQYGQQHGQMSPRGYSTPGGGPHIKLDQAPSNPSSYQNASAVPSVLQPGGSLARPAPIGNNTAPTLPTMAGSISQQQEYQTPAKPQLNLSHSYSRSSPSAAAYDGPSNPGFSPYTPTTPNAGGPSSSQFMSPADRRYDAPGSQRNISHTPLGLADIRPRADSSLSDGMPAGFDLGTQNAPQGTSNYMAPWASYAFDWCKWAPQGNGAGKVAIGSYLEDGHNFVSPLFKAIHLLTYDHQLTVVLLQIQILDTQITPTPSDVYNQHGGSKWTMDFTKIAEATHSFPVTRLLWEPPSSTKQSTDLLATSGDHLRLWSLPSETPSTPGNSITGRNREVATTKLTPLALLSNSKTPDHTAPLTSLDWNTVSPSLIITSSIDTTCTIWDIPSLTAKTQLIAHDKEVYDVRFCANSVDVFVSCGQDGSVRMFDLRSLEHSTIIYEPTGKEDRGISHL